MLTSKLLIYQVKTNFICQNPNWVAFVVVLRQHCSYLRAETTFQVYSRNLWPIIVIIIIITIIIIISLHPLQNEIIFLVLLAVAVLAHEFSCSIPQSS